MGTKGSKKTERARKAADDIVERLAPIGTVTARGMFGGYGIFEGDTMFGLVNASGVFNLRVDEETEPTFVEAGAAKFGRMPYYTVPDSVCDDVETLQSWAETAAAVARSTKRS